MQVRLNYMTQLLPDAYAYLHTSLTASVLNVRLFMLPFHRNVDLNAEGTAAMHASLTWCKQVRNQSGAVGRNDICNLLKAVSWL